MVYLVGRLSADVVVEGGACAFGLATGSGVDHEQGHHVVRVVGPAVRRCAALRRNARVSVEGRVVGLRRVVATRVLPLE